MRCPECGGKMVRRKDWEGSVTWYWLECVKCGHIADLPLDEQEYLDYWDQKTGRPRRW